MSEWLEDIHDASDRLRTNSYELQDLAQAFLITGNSKVFNQLSEIASEVMEDSDKARKAAGSALGEQLKHSQDATLNMMTACLAGVKIGEQGHE